MESQVKEKIQELMSNKYALGYGIPDLVEFLSNTKNPHDRKLILEVISSKFESMSLTEIIQILPCTYGRPSNTKEISTLIKKEAEKCSAKDILDAIYYEYYSQSGRCYVHWTDSLFSVLKEALRQVNNPHTLLSYYKTMTSSLSGFRDYFRCCTGPCISRILKITSENIEEYENDLNLLNKCLDFSKNADSWWKTSYQPFFQKALESALHKKVTELPNNTNLWKLFDTWISSGRSKILLDKMAEVIITTAPIDEMKGIVDVIKGKTMPYSYYSNIIWPLLEDSLGKIPKETFEGVNLSNSIQNYFSAKKISNYGCRGLYEHINDLVNEISSDSEDDIQLLMYTLENPTVSSPSLMDLFRKKLIEISQ